MKDSLANLKAWAHWALIEAEPVEDRVQMANAIIELFAENEKLKQIIEMQKEFLLPVDLNKLPKNDITTLVIK